MIIQLRTLIDLVVLAGTIVAYLGLRSTGEQLRLMRDEQQAPVLSEAEEASESR